MVRPVSIVVLVLVVSAAGNSFVWSQSCDSPCDRDACGPSDMYNAIWMVNANAIALHRERPSGDVLFENAVQTSQNLQGSDFDFGYAAGFDLSLIRCLGAGQGVEVRYLKDDGWNSTTAVSTSDTDPLRINTATPIFLPGGGTIDASYGSQLDNLEINYRRTNEWLTSIVGFRYIELDERFDAGIDTTSAGLVSYDTTTQNRLYGIQLGVEALLWEHAQWSIGAAAKAGIFHNSGSQNSELATNAFQSRATGSEDKVAMLGEIGLTARYCLTENLSIRGGYGLLAIDGLVLATDQVRESDFAYGTGIDGDGEVLYHGAFLGLEYLY